MPRFPVPTTLPGLGSVLRDINYDAQGRPTSAHYTNNGTNFVVAAYEASGMLTVTAALGQAPTDTVFHGMASFAPWPAVKDPHPELHAVAYPTVWSVTAVNTTIMPGFRLADALYAFARDWLAADGRKLAPSDSIQPDGKRMWERFDPAIVMVSREPYYPCDEWPDLTGRTPPTASVVASAPPSPPTGASNSETST